MVRLLLRVLAAAALLLIVAALALRYATPPLDWRADFDGDGCCVDIVHAGGLLDGAPYTNSLEALRQNYALGRRIFEVDFALTSDGAVVLAHDWDRYGGVAPDHAAFMASGPPTRLDLAGFVAWVAAECLYCQVVTDPKFPFPQFWEAYIAATTPALRQQFILQTYDIKTARALAAGAPAQRQILTLYRLPEVAPADLASLAPLDSLIAITMSLDRLPLGSARVRELSGKPVFSHGYPWAMENEFILRLARLFGATGFYKD